MYNLPIKLWGHHNKITAFYDALINSMMFSYILFITLVFTHALTANTSIERKKFYFPKLVISGLVWISKCISIFMDELNILAYYDNMFEPVEEPEFRDRVAWLIFTFVMFVYMVLQSIYLYRAYDV